MIYLKSKEHTLMGQWHNASSTYEVINPSLNEKLADIPLSSQEELELSVQSGSKAQKIWV